MFCISEKLYIFAPDCASMPQLKMVLASQL